MRAGFGGARGGGGPRGGDAAQGSAPPEAATPAGAEGGDQEGVMAQLQDLRAKVDAGEITQDSMRTVIASLAGSGGFGGRGGGASTADSGVPPRQSRPAVVFVLSADSIPEPRLVQIGLNDWDKTQVVSGVEAGETLVVVGAAQLMAQQTEFLNRMRERMGGGSPFGGGSRGGGRGR